MKTIQERKLKALENARLAHGIAEELLESAEEDRKIGRAHRDAKSLKMALSRFDTARALYCRAMEAARTALMTIQRDELYVPLTLFNEPDIIALMKMVELARARASGAHCEFMEVLDSLTAEVAGDG